MSEGDSGDEEALDWRTLGTFGPHTTAQSPGPRRDLGAGGSLVDEADRARALRQAGQLRWSAPSVLYIAGSVVLVTGVVLVLAMSGLAGVLLGALGILADLMAVLVGARVQLSHAEAEARLRQRARTERRVAAELETLTVSGWRCSTIGCCPIRITGWRMWLSARTAWLWWPRCLPGPCNIVGHVLEGEDYCQLYVGALHLDTWLNSRRWEVEQLEPALANTLQDTVWRGLTVPLAVHVPSVTWRDWLWLKRSTAVPDMPFEWRGVEMRPLVAVAEMLAGLPSSLARTEVATVAAAVEQICPPAGRADRHSADPST